MNKQKSPTDIVDLSNLTKASLLIDDVIRRKKAEQIKATLAASLQSLSSDEMGFADALIAIIADIAAQVEVLSHACDPRLADKKYQLSIDPIEHIGLDRSETTATDIKTFELELDEPMFSGAGWYELSKQGDFSWRWSDSRGFSSLVLPTLGGGRLRITTAITFTTTKNVDEDTLDIVVGGKRIEPFEIKNEGVSYAMVFDVELPEDSGFGQFVLMLRLGDGVGTREFTNQAEQNIEFGIMSLKIQLL